MSTQIYKGLWTNWSHGKIVGATLTVSAQNGGLLIAFLALFITLVGSQLWRFICYVIHQIRSTNQEKDITFHRYQVVLRNNATPGTAAWAFLKTGFNGLRYEWHSLLHAVPWIAFSTVYLVAFALAAVFSSYISKAAGNERLVNSSVCGMWLDSNDSSTADWNAKQNNETYTAAAYARECYGGGQNSPQCVRMPTNRITYTTNRNDSCPFESGICVYGDTAAFNVTSSLIDSQQHLGINAPPQDRVLFQLSKSCAPLNTTDRVNRYIATSNDSTGFPGDGIFEYQFGTALGVLGTARSLNASYTYNNHTLFSRGGYVLSGMSAWANQSGKVEWDPISALQRSDADLSIFFLEAPTIHFESSNNDPMFGAHIPFEYEDGSIDYRSDHFVTVMACAEQIRLCNPRNNFCLPYMGYLSLLRSAGANEQGLRLNDQQRATSLRLAVDLLYSVLRDQVDRRMAAALRATESANGILQIPLPDDQWMIEVMSWFEIALARFQLKALEYASGPSDATYNKYYTLNTDLPQFREMCHNQIIHDTSNTVSFSVLGLVICFAIGGIIIVLNQLAEVLVGFVQKSTGKGAAKRRCWNADDVFELQTTALETKTHIWLSKLPAYTSGHYKHLELGRLSYPSAVSTQVDGRESTSMSKKGSSIETSPSPLSPTAGPPPVQPQSQPLDFNVYGRRHVYSAVSNSDYDVRDAMADGRHYYRPDQFEPYQARNHS